MFVGAGCAAYGIMLLVLAPERIPAPWRSKSSRRPWAVCMILLGVGLSVSTML
jgi:hypothetical protein